MRWPRVSLGMKTLSQPSSLAEKKDLWKEIAAHPFLTGMSAHHLELLTRYATRKIFEPGELIFRAGEPAHGFYLIQNGTIVLEGSVMEHGSIATDTVRAGEPLGWSWLFPPYVWHFDARAAEPTTAIFFYGTILRQYCDKDPALGLELFKRMSEIMMRRLQQARKHLIEELTKGRKKN